MDPEVIATVKTKMLKAIAALQEDLATIRTGRATPALVENVVVTAYDGTQHLKIKEMATITTDGPKTIVIAPFDPSVIRDIEKGIQAANLGFTGSVDGNIIRCTLPVLTSERREEFIKLAHTKVEGGRVMVRQVRHEAMSTVKRQGDNKEISEDDHKRLEKQIQDLTDEMMADIDAIRERKETELREV